MNREIGIGVFQNLDISARLDRPDSTIIIDTRYDTINLEIKSIFIEENTISMTELFHKLIGLAVDVRKRCRLCNNTGQLYPDSVQSLVAAPFMKATHSTENLFHGMGSRGH